MKKTNIEKPHTPITIFTLLLSALFALFVPTTAFAEKEGESITFVVGEGGTFKTPSDIWPGNQGKNGWVSDEVLHSASGTKAQIALVSSANVWSANTGQGNVSTSEYPLICKLTDLQSIVGPNIHIYNGFIIESVKIKVFNKYPAIDDNSGSNFNTNYIRLSVGRKAHKEDEQLIDDGPVYMTDTNTGTSTPTYNNNSVEYSSTFTAYTPLPIIVERSSATSFQRETYDDGTLQDIYAYCRIEVTVKKVKQSVLYQIYDSERDENGKLKADQPLTKKDAYYATGDGKNSDTRFYKETVTQYVGQAPSVPGSLRRMGCIYGYDKSYIEEADGNFLVKVYYTVNDEDLPFHYSTTLSSPEYRYYLSSKTPYLDGRSMYQSKSNETAITVNPTNAATVAFVGDPYNTLWSLLDQTFTGLGKQHIDASTNTYQYQTNYSYWDILLVKESADAEVESNYFAMRDHTPSSTPNYNYLGVTRFNSSGEEYSGSYNRTRVYPSTNSGSSYAHQQTEFFKYDDDGAFYFDHTGSGTLNAWQPKGFLLTLGQRAENIYVTYEKYFRDASGTKQMSFYNKEGGEEEEVLRKNMYVGDQVILEAKYLHPYHVYHYYTDAAFTNEIDTIPKDWVKGNNYTIYVLVEWNEDAAPFIPSTADNPKWYYLTLNGKLVSARGHYPYGLEDTPSDYYITPNHLWRFERNEDGSITVKNRWFGEEFSLTNINGDYVDENDNPIAASYNGYTGPMMEPDAGLESNEWSAKWQIMEVTDELFGLRSYKVKNGKTMAQSHMNICDHKNEGLMRYYSNYASLEAYSRFQAYPYEEGTLSTIANDVGSAKLAQYIADMPTNRLFGFKTSGISGTTNEDKLVNPDNYNTEITTGYARIHFTYSLTDESGNPIYDENGVRKTEDKYIAVRANLAPKDVAFANVITRDKIRAWLTTAESTNDATGIFNLRRTAGTTHRRFNGRLVSENFNVNTAIAASAKDVKEGKFNDCTVTIYPYGLGQVVICADKSNAVGYESGADMQLAYKKPTNEASSASLLLESAYLTPTPCYLEPAHAYITLGAMNGSSYASIYLPYDIQLPEGVTAYRATAVDEDNDKLTIAACELSDRILPAATPVILICEDGSVSGRIEVPIPNTEPKATALQGTNLFEGTYYNFTVPAVSEEDGFTEKEHDKFRLFGRGSAGAAAGVAGFYPFITNEHCRVPENRAYIDKSYVNSEIENSAQAVSTQLFLVVAEVDDDNNTTSVKAVISSDGIYDDTPEFYDLQGRRVHNAHGGIFIVRSSLTGESRKVYIK